MMAASGDAAGGTSSARRRRERRLRSWAKHERLSVAMATAEKLHHSANRTALSKEEEVEQDYALRGQKPARAGPGMQYLFVGGVSVPEPVGGALAAGSGSPAHNGAEDRAHAVRADHRRSCAAEGGLCVGCVQGPGQLDCRAGYRSAQAVVFFVSFPFALSGTLDGGTVGGSADDHTLFFVARDGGADRGHSSS